MLFEQMIVTNTHCGQNSFWTLQRVAHTVVGFNQKSCFWDELRTAYDTRKLADMRILTGTCSLTCLSCTFTTCFYLKMVNYAIPSRLGLPRAIQIIITFLVTAPGIPSPLTHAVQSVQHSSVHYLSVRSITIHCPKFIKNYALKIAT